MHGCYMIERNVRGSHFGVVGVYILNKNIDFNRDTVDKRLGKILSKNIAL